MFVGICNPDAVNIRIFNPKKRIENAYTQSGRIAKLRLSDCSANSFEHCRTRAVYLNPPERPCAEHLPLSRGRDATARIRSLGH